MTKYKIKFTAPDGVEYEHEIECKTIWDVVSEFYQTHCGECDIIRIEKV